MTLTFTLLWVLFFYPCCCLFVDFKHKLYLNRKLTVVEEDWFAQTNVSKRTSNSQKTKICGAAWPVASLGRPPGKPPTIGPWMLEWSFTNTNIPAVSNFIQPLLWSLSCFFITILQLLVWSFDTAQKKSQYPPTPTPHSECFHNRKKKKRVKQELRKALRKSH